MNVLAETHRLCKLHGIRPARSKGQNFLIRESVYDKIVATAGIQKNDTVLEVGPGLGFLTEKLARKAKRVVAVELDDKLAISLRERLHGQGVENVEVVNEDILKISNIKYQISNKIQSSNTKHVLIIPKDKTYKIVANLPYNITSRFLRKFLSEVENKPIAMVLMLQKEVALRLTAKPGQMSLLAVSVQAYADVRIVSSVPREAFWPMPKVDSAIVSLKVHEVKNFNSRDVALPRLDETQFFMLVKAGFSAKRKLLASNITKHLPLRRADVDNILEECGFAKTVRAQELSVEDWQKLCVVLRGRNVL